MNNQQRSKIQKIILFTILLTTFLILETKLLKTSLDKFNKLKEETTHYKNLYYQTQRSLQDFGIDFHKDKAKWKNKIKDMRDGLKSMNEEHEKEERGWREKYVEEKKRMDRLKLELGEEEARKREERMKLQHDKLNIVLLYADDWRYDTFSAAGNPVIQTPNLDKLATEGMMFSHNCVTTSICWISRGTLQTGQYLSRHKSPRIAEPNFLQKWNETYNYLLQKGGYYTGFVGKWHYWKDPPREGFDVYNHYYGWHVEKGVHITNQNEKDALKFLKKRPKDKPFALTVSFFATHALDGTEEQFIPQESSMSLYEEVEIPVPVSATQESWERLPKFFNEGNEGRIRWHWRFDTPEKYQLMMKNYYRMATEVDTACGNIIKMLKKQGVYDNTLIIFTTDNGYYHGEHGLADKWYPHQESIRVPLVIRDPRMSKSNIGKQNDEFTLNIDLAPTMLSAANISPPKSMQGRDMSHLYRDGFLQTPWRKEFFYEHPSIDNQENWIPTSEALVRKKFKYISWPGHDTEQLFDLVNDPFEERDLVKESGFADVLDEMRNRFYVLKEEAK